MASYARANIDRLHAYVPGEQPAGGPVIKLNTNENPYPPSPKVMEAIAAVPAEALRRYPSPTAQGFRQTAQRIHGLPAGSVIATNGGDELLRLIITTFCEPAGSEAQASSKAEGGIGYADPSYSLYPVLADIHDTPTVCFPLDADWQLPTDYADQLNASGCRVSFIVNPHAPTGVLTANDVLAEIASGFEGILVIDEAYTDFADDSALPLVEQFDNVILLRSMSKGYGLAGLRFGYGIASPALIGAMDKARDSYNTDALSQAAATAALEDQAYAAQTWAKVIDERTRVTDELLGRGWGVLPSQSNFILAIPKDPGRENYSAGALYEGLKANNILVRYFNADRLDDKLRITIGTPEQNDALLTAIDALAATVG